MRKAFCTTERAENDFRDLGRESRCGSLQNGRLRENLRKIQWLQEFTFLVFCQVCTRNIADIVLTGWLVTINEDLHTLGQLLVSGRQTGKILHLHLLPLTRVWAAWGWKWRWGDGFPVHEDELCILHGEMIKGSGVNTRGGWARIAIQSNLGVVSSTSHDHDTAVILSPTVVLQRPWFWRYEFQNCYSVNHLNMSLNQAGVLRGQNEHHAWKRSSAIRIQIVYLMFSRLILQAKRGQGQNFCTPSALKRCQPRD